MAEKALAAVIQEADIQGVSTRSVDDLVQAMGMSGVSKSQVSRLCGEIDDKVNGFLDRSLEGDWPYLWLDATYVKVREAGRIVSVAVTVAVAVNDQGRREVLGMAIGASEAEAFWTEFLRSLARRGLRGVKLLVSDDHKGLKAAATRILGATWQRCRVHFARNLLAHAGRQGRRVVSAFVATAFAQEDADSAKAQWRQVADQLRPKVPKLAVLMDEAEHDVLAYMTFPKEHRQKLHSTNEECLVQDIEGAKRLLGEAGWRPAPDGIRQKDGMRLSILYQTSTNAVRQDFQALIKQWWSEIGVETELRNIDASVFFGGDPNSPNTSHKFFADIEMYANNFEGADPEPYLGGWRCGNEPRPASKWRGANVPRYCSGEYDRLLGEMAKTGDLGERARLAKAMNDMLVQDHVLIPLVHRGRVSAHAHSLGGVLLNTWDSEIWNIADWYRIR